MSKGSLIVFSGPSGTGKSTICNYLCNRFKRVNFSTSVTTRPIRESEKEGIDYFFIDIEKFKKLIEEDAFAEWGKVHGNYYGTLWNTINKSLKNGENLLLDIDVIGGLNIKKKLPETLLIFIMPPSLEELKNRLFKRKTDKVEVIEKRMINAKAEIDRSHQYDEIVVNDDLDKTFKIVGELVENKINENIDEE
jgi:guanylate kinase